jgi:uncharacterized membrane protein YphA (DoxX/SURF4 family)
MKLNEVRLWLEERRDLLIDLLRIYLGLGLFIRGLVFFMGGSQIMLQGMAGSDANGWIVSAVAAHYVVFAHVCGGILLAFGLLTRIAALVQFPILLGAVILHAPDGMCALGQSLEFSAFVLVTLVFILLAGPGRLSVDYYTFRRSEEASANQKAAKIHGH